MPVTVRDGQIIWPNCTECGCRLKNRGEIWSHFLNWNRTADARGCKCKNLNKSWVNLSDGFHRFLTFTNIVEY
jgi:hypothetical protein